MFFQFLNKRSNYKREVRYKQFVMPMVAVLYSVVLLGFMGKFYELVSTIGETINNFLSTYGSNAALNTIKEFFFEMGAYIALAFMNIATLLLYIIVKKLVLAFFKENISPDTVRGMMVGLVYEFDEDDYCWYLKKSRAHVRTFIKTAYYVVYTLSVSNFFVSYELYERGVLTLPFCPIISIIVMSELAFFVEGLMKGEGVNTLIVNNDQSKRIAMYALLRKPLKKLFGDKLASEGTTINIAGMSGGTAEDILASIEKSDEHIGENYANFMRKKIDGGLIPNVDYLRSGYDLAVGKSLLFNTPFYDKLIPYAFYAVNRCLLTGKKVLVVMGRHGTEDDIIKWCQKGMSSVTNVPNLYKISVLSGTVSDEDQATDIGIISRSGVHDLNIHKANIQFLQEVGFVVIIEPSRLVTTAQIGLNLLIKCCGEDNDITFCSMDRNCDGLVDSLSHILMTNITEVSATEYPHGMSSFMCWKADDEHLQHRLFSGVSRYLGLGTELSFVALKNQVKQTVWYGGEVYPVLDAHWISKQYYYELLKYANLPTTQECFDQYFKTSFNMCNECVSDYSYVTVEDDRNNLFEARRNFATIAEKQGFVNVISSQYMLREYMADNTGIFTADAKAVPYITADYARTKRNSLLALCLLLCVGNVPEKDLKRKLSLMGLESDNCKEVLWKEICELFSTNNEVDRDSILIFKREYSVESGKFENAYTIENKDFAGALLDDLQNAAYIAELEGKDYYIGTELKGHVYQKYLPGQFFTLNGKYYEMISTTSDNKILVRRASEHINGRISYRQVRNYTLNKIRNSEDMGTQKTVKDIDIHYLYADFEVSTKGYWKLKEYNDFENGALVEINAVPTRKYVNKQILKLDFSAFGDLFTDPVRKTLTVLLNEVFVTLFAENQPFISAITIGECEIPSTYSLCTSEENANFDHCIFIIEDSQLDIGLLVAVERNLERIMQIVSDYLLWNKEKLQVKVEEEYVGEGQVSADEETSQEENVDALMEKKTKENIFAKIFGKIKSFFDRKKKEPVVEVPAEDSEAEAVEETETVEDTEEVQEVQNEDSDGEETPIELEEESEVTDNE